MFVCFPVVPEQVPNLLLTTPTQAELENGTATFICLASQFSPKDFKFFWKRDNKEVGGQAKKPILTEEKSKFTVYTAISILELSDKEWVDDLSTIKCEFHLKDKIYSREAKYTSMYTFYLLYTCRFVFYLFECKVNLCFYSVMGKVPVKYIKVKRVMYSTKRCFH